MKKVAFILLFSAALGFGAQAQFTHLDVHAGVGYGRIVDNLISKGGVLGFEVGAYTNLGIKNAKSMVAENLYFQFGVNLKRKGGAFAEEHTVGGYLSQREGNYKAYYAQIPFLVNYKYELPLRQPNHYVRAFIGPAFSVGLFGTYNDRKVSPYQPQRSMNYELKNEPVFNYMNRLDANLIFGVGYEYDEFAVSLYVDYGFLSIHNETDKVRLMEGASTNPGSVPSATDSQYLIPGGNLLSFYLQLSYRIPFRKYEGIED